MKYRLVNKEITKNYLYELLKERGVEDINAFLNPTDEYIQEPNNLDNLKAGWELVVNTIKDNKTILLVVDCDVDGLTSSAIFYMFMKEKFPDCQIVPYLHEHKEHGLGDTIKDTGVSSGKYGLVVLPDAGTNDYQYIEELKLVNTKVLIIDHHLKDNDIDISDNCIIINNQLSDNYKNKHLTGAGVVWQFVRSIDRELAEKYTDLAALGIISDMGSALSIENRAIIKKGLDNITNFFFKTACQKQDYSMGGKINYNTVAFYITPMLNSMIRIGTMPEKNRLFTALIDGKKLIPSLKRGEKGQLTEVAAESLRECTNTKSRQDKVTNAAVEQLGIKIFNNNLLDNKILFVELEDENDFPQEVNGLIATKLSAQYKRPTLIGRKGQDGKIKGSIRGLNNSELTSLRDFLLSSKLFDYVSGHSQAAGYSLPYKKISQLLEYANEQLKNMEFSENHYEVNFVRSAADNDLIPLIKEIGSNVEAWGQDCKEPLIYINNIHLTKDDFQIIGTRKDTIKFQKFGITYIKFFAKEMIDQISQYDKINLEIVGKANLNEWGNTITPQIIIENYEIKEDNIYTF